MVMDTEQQLELEVPPGERLVPLTIQSTVMFRPADENPALSDSRGLGCQVRLVLE